MDFSEYKTQRIARAAAGLESWFETVHGEDGYRGPSIGLRDTGIAFCGAGYDWRYEGLLDGFCQMYWATRDTAYLDAAERSLVHIQSAQLLNGAFRNSYFEYNPMEGGMPHEPAMLAAVCRTLRCLTAAGKTLPAGVEAMVYRYVHHHLLKQLWNKKLQTFNDWPTSEFQYYSPASAAAVIELLLEVADRTGEWNTLEHYVTGAADSLLHAQIKTGPLAGGMPPSSRGDAGVSPFLAARCLPALAAVAKKLNNDVYRVAATSLEEFLRRQSALPGGWPKMVFADRPPMHAPVFTGAIAGILTAMHRAERLTGDDLKNPLEFILAQQTASGAFRTAAGFGQWRKPSPIPDWRDVLPVCGWQDKIFALLACLHPGERASFTPAEVVQEVRIQHRSGAFREDAQSIRIELRGGQPLFHWNKNQKWPSVCLLE